MNFSSSISAFVAKFEIQDIAEFFAIQFCDSRVLIILGCRIFPYLQTPEIAFLRTKSLSSPNLEKRISNVSSLGNSDMARIAEAHTFEFAELLKAKEALKNDSNYYVRRF
jgi:hypothetical protein